MIISDLHIHSKYSRATSKNMEIKFLGDYAKKKGLDLLGTGDFTHPEYFRELKENLREFNEGVYECSGTKFILTAEISLIYGKNKKTRRVHHLIFAENMDSAEQINERLSKIGNLKSDGRPIIGMTSPELAEIVMEISDKNFIVPAHAWTPWFGIIGANSGFNTIKECFEDQSKHIHAIETGLSSDPLMNWRVSGLDEYALISNSDAHSPGKIGREANVFDVDPDKISFDALINAIKNRDSSKFAYTIEVPPEFGKYHYTGHRDCKVVFAPEKAVELKNMCPVCGKKLTVGVEQRVEELADREQGFTPKNAIPFRNIIPLSEICAFFKSKNEEKFIEKFQNELNVLMNAPLEELSKVDERVSGVIEMLRERKLKISPGYDGVYGEIFIDEGALNKGKTKGMKQRNLLDFS